MHSPGVTRIPLWAWREELAEKSLFPGQEEWPQIHLVLCV